MKWIKKLLLTLFLLLIVALITAYVGIQTVLGARWFSEWASDRTGYQLSVEKISHSLFRPLYIELREVNFTQAQKASSGFKGTIGLDFNLSIGNQKPYLRQLLLQNGAIKLTTTHSSFLSIKAQQLQLENIDIDITNNDLNLNAKGVRGGITPLQITNGRFTDENSQWEVSIDVLGVDGVSAKNVLIQGSTQQGSLLLSNFGADIAQGELTGQAQQQADGSWQIDNLRLSHIRWQSSLSLEKWRQQIARLPILNIKRFDLFNAKLEGPDWVFSELDTTANNVVLRNGQVVMQEGEINLNATNMIMGDWQFTDPIIKLEVSPDVVNIKQATTRWESGIVRTSGSWLRTEKKLQLDELTIVGLEYILPGQWYQIWQKTLPIWLQQLTIKKLTANRNLIIDTDVNFPFQITQFDVSGKDLLLVKEQQFGIWQGELVLNASDATFNKIDLRYPSLKLQADQQQIKFIDASAFAEGGLLEATATLDLTQNKVLNLALHGRAVPFGLLHAWGWGDVLVGKGNIQLALQGKVADTIPFKETLQGKLTLADEKGNRHQQMMHNGVVEKSIPFAVK